MELEGTHLHTVITRLRKRGVIKSEGLYGTKINVTKKEWRSIRAWAWLREEEVIVSGGRSPDWVDSFLKAVQKHDPGTRYVVAGNQVTPVTLDDISEMLHSPCTVITPPDKVWVGEGVRSPEMVGWFPVMASGKINPTMTEERQDAKNLGDRDPLAAYVYR